MTAESDAAFEKWWPTYRDANDVFASEDEAKWIWDAGRADLLAHASEIAVLNEAFPIYECGFDLETGQLFTRSKPVIKDGTEPF